MPIRPDKLTEKQYQALRNLSQALHSIVDECWDDNEFHRFMVSLDIFHEDVTSIANRITIYAEGFKERNCIEWQPRLK